MSEVDRLSNSGLYPALPIADRKRDREAPDGGKPSAPRARSNRGQGEDPGTAAQPEPKSGIDEYA